MILKTSNRQPPNFVMSKICDKIGLVTRVDMPRGERFLLFSLEKQNFSEDVGGIFFKMEIFKRRRPNSIKIFLLLRHFQWKFSSPVTHTALFSVVLLSGFSLYYLCLKKQKIFVRQSGPNFFSHQFQLFGKKVEFSDQRKHACT